MRIEMENDRHINVTDHDIRKIRKYAKRILEDVEDDDIGSAMMWAQVAGRHVNKLYETKMDWREKLKEYMAKGYKSVEEIKQPDSADEEISPLANVPEDFNTLHNMKFGQAVLMLNKRKSCAFENITMSVRPQMSNNSHLQIEGTITQNRRLSKKGVYPNPALDIKRARIAILCKNTGRTAMTVMVNKGTYRILEGYDQVQKGVYKYGIILYADDVTVIK